MHARRCGTHKSRTAARIDRLLFHEVWYQASVSEDASVITLYTEVGSCAEVSFPIGLYIHGADPHIQHRYVQRYAYIRGRCLCTVIYDAHREHIGTQALWVDNERERKYAVGCLHCCLKGPGCGRECLLLCCEVKAIGERVPTTELRHASY